MLDIQISDPDKTQLLPNVELSQVGEHGEVVIPERFRKKFGMRPGTLLLAEQREHGIFIQAIALIPIEIQGRLNMAEYHLSNAVDDKDYKAAVKEYRAAAKQIRKLGVKPKPLPQPRPPAAEK